MSLEACIAELARAGSVPISVWPVEEDPEDFGLGVEAGRVVPIVDYDPLSADRIRSALSSRAAAWLRRLEVHPVIGSTNAMLIARAEAEPIGGSLCLAELQVRGRGRRGRDWVSPFGANLAVSLGLNVAVPARSLGGASLVVGLAVLDALESLGGAGLCLKWPNDVMLGDAKLGGILIEASQRRGIELVVGIGLNVVLPDVARDRLPGNVSDLRRAGIGTPRSELAAGVVSSVVEFVGEFEVSGFEPFRAAFDARHGFHGRACDVVQGDIRVTGTVMGVSADGELVLDTAAGARAFSAGDVSLRQSS